MYLEPKHHARPDASEGKWSQPCFNLKALVIPHGMTTICDISCTLLSWCTLRSSERVVPTSSAPLLTNQHKNADVSFIDLRFCIPEISWVRSSKLPPLLRGGDKKVIFSSNLQITVYLIAGFEFFINHVGEPEFLHNCTKSYLKTWTTFLPTVTWVLQPYTVWNQKKIGLLISVFRTRVCNHVSPERTSQL